MSNPCIKCGKQRIDGKSWKEKSGNSTIFYTKTICPDSACQKLLDQETADRIAKNELILKNKAEAKLAREKLLASN
ncbi:MAG: hypothetical protein G01um10147_974 [Microgenomates group bacterium Gr01-1014_7]|nr:MAG: hypothetical protein G01um10147_974 [Microgenomates group bacterium Gr01-1014_7]